MTTQLIAFHVELGNTSLSLTTTMMTILLDHVETTEVLVENVQGHVTTIVIVTTVETVTTVEVGVTVEIGIEVTIVDSGIVTTVETVTDRNHVHVQNVIPVRITGLSVISAMVATVICIADN